MHVERRKKRKEGKKWVIELMDMYLRGLIYFKCSTSTCPLPLISGKEGKYFSFLHGLPKDGHRHERNH